MPTGYTAPVEDGTLTDFKTFALRCARNLGACIHQRDESIDVPPRHREPDTWHADQLAVAQKALAALEVMTLAEIEQAAREDHTRQLDIWRKSRARVLLENARYDAMLDKVHAWQPPTPEHACLKAFMIEQLETSRHQIEVAAPAPELPGDWHRRRTDEATRHVAYHAKELEASLLASLKANAWIDALFASLEVER